MPTDIAFLAIAEAQQLYHWLPAALELARRPDVRVSILSPSDQILALVESYDPTGSLRRVRLRRPPSRPDSLFRQPSRLATLLLNYPTIARFPTLVTTEISSAWLRRVPGFRSRLILIKHGAGDREGGYKKRHRDFDLTLVAGEKDRRRMIDRGLCTAETVAVGGYPKFDLKADRQRFFPDDKPVLLYNPHFDPALSSWINHGPAMLAALESLTDWNVIIAPHTKLAIKAPPIVSSAPHIRVDMGSRHSIDMSYTMSADVYLGDVSSQVYEFLIQPRPCIFLNLDHRDASGDAFAHWKLGQVIERADALPQALARANDLQPGFVAAQEAAMQQSIDLSPVPASQRQADLILNFAKKGV
ncbi:CDP-glycerol glycerophosphotransferase family protein [Sphingobium limneticum]|uniref:Glycosyl transferase n=1 Tax=Sphingobium limneticum TaxID=1007511 RepID=A0A5J5I9M8_9SPHN|nr:CDP-glycerol glycerophosphotransferase family protein [Sphingobium limneticum]KAA9020852.1 glycosyl transferase [Sphingobium limneticum]KAA9033179.1 glycosyl transferase [Sphingobium limneticum]